MSGVETPKAADKSISELVTGWKAKVAASKKVEFEHEGRDHEEDDHEGGDCEQSTGDDLEQRPDNTMPVEGVKKRPAAVAGGDRERGGNVREQGVGDGSERRPDKTMHAKCVKKPEETTGICESTGYVHNQPR